MEKHKRIPSMTTKQKGLTLLLLFIALTVPGIALAETLNAPPPPGTHFPGADWDTIRDPSMMGWSKSGLEKARQFFMNSGVTSAMIVDDGVAIAQWGDFATRVNSKSMRKSMLSALIGIAVDKGEIDINMTMAQLGIDDLQGLTPAEKQARIVDLMMCRSGVYHPAAYETSSMRKSRPARGAHSPGTFYYYNNWDFNTLGAIYRNRTGSDIFRSFQRLIAEPTQMQDYRPTDGRYIEEKVSRYPAYPFYISTRDRARFGLLFLRKGIWKGKSVIPKGWVEESTSPLIDTPRKVAYGYMWWVSRSGKKHLGVRVSGSAYSARGTWGQRIVVIPETRLVIVQSSDKEGGAPNGSRSFRKLLELILEAKAM